MILFSCVRKPLIFDDLNDYALIVEKYCRIKNKNIVSSGSTLEMILKRAQICNVYFQNVCGKSTVLFWNKYFIRRDFRVLIHLTVTWHSTQTHIIFIH